MDSSLLAPPMEAAELPPLDISDLLDDEAFESEAAWLNDILASTSTSTEDTAPASLAALDTKLAQTLGLLELATHDTSALVDRTIDDISRSVPRLAFDLQLMRENALLLKLSLEGIRKRADSSGSAIGEQSEVSRVMEKLRVLDLVKARMEAARDVLREAESWSTLESEVTVLVGEQAYGKAAERLEEAARSMIVFQNTTEYEGRRALMVSLQNQLEASLSASLVAAINTRDVKACKVFYGIFGQIQRESEFTAYYFGSRRATLVDNWSNANLVDCDELASADGLPSSRPSLKFTAFLSKFYSDLHSLLNEERTYIPAIFPSAAPTLSSFIQTTLEGLSPSFPHRLSALSDRYGPLALPELILAYKATEEFAIMFERIMSKVSSGSSTTSTSTTTKMDRRLSKRMSVSKRRSSRSASFGSQSDFLASHEPVRAWETALFEPFLDWQVEYPELERKYLAAEILRQTDGSDVMESLLSGASERGVKVLWEHSVAVFGFAEDAIGRALALTHGYAARGLVDAVDGQLGEFMDRRSAELVKARKGGVRPRPRPKGDDDDDALELEGLEYSTEDWSSFQFGLRLLDTCRAITDRLSSFEGRLRTRLTGIAQAVKDARSDPLEYTVPGTTRGAVTMLRQSVLNSMELATLLAPLEPPSAESLSSPSSPSPLPLPPATLLPRARMSTTEFTRSTQLFLHSTILAPLLAHLHDYASLPTWTTPAEQRPGGKGAFDLSIPTFSLSPTETISRVGEGLFNLPRLFEIYADDDALAFSLETLPFVDVDALLPPPSPAPGSTSTFRPTRVSSLDLLPSPPLPCTSSLPRGPSPPPSPTALSAERVIATWLTSLTLSILSHLTTVVLPSLSRLSTHGAAQLGADLSYMANVARALDVESSEELGVWGEAVVMDEMAYRELEVGVERGVLDKVARMRGYRVGN
jgi:hypothetical protein